MAIGCNGSITKQLNCCLRGGFGEKISEVRRETYAALSPLSLSLNTVPSTRQTQKYRSSSELQATAMQPQPDLSSLQAFLDASMSSDPLVVQPDDADTQGMSFADLFRSALISLSLESRPTVAAAASSDVGWRTPTPARVFEPIPASHTATAFDGRASDLVQSLTVSTPYPLHWATLRRRMPTSRRTRFRRSGLSPTKAGSCCTHRVLDN